MRHLTLLPYGILRYYILLRYCKKDMLGGRAVLSCQELWYRDCGYNRFATSLPFWIDTQQEQTGQASHTCAEPHLYATSGTCAAGGMKRWMCQLAQTSVKLASVSGVLASALGTSLNARFRSITPHSLALSMSLRLCGLPAFPQQPLRMCRAVRRVYHRVSSQIKSAHPYTDPECRLHLARRQLAAILLACPEPEMQVLQ